MPSQENVERFWKGIWESRSQVNYENTLWMKQLKKEYCNKVTTKTYQITEDIIETAVNKIQPNKAPGRDLKQLNLDQALYLVESYSLLFREYLQLFDRFLLLLWLLVQKL